MVFEDKIRKYLIEEQEDDKPDLDFVFDKMVDLISSLDISELKEDQMDIVGEILSGLHLIDVDSDSEVEDESDADDDDDDEDLEEDLSEKKIQKIKRRQHLALKKAYKRNKAKFKMMNKMFRKTAAYKMWKKKHKRMVKAGRTRKKKYV